MCTILAKKLPSGWILGKTRDPVPDMRWDDEMKLFEVGKQDSCQKLIVQNPDPYEDGYYGGINEYGVAVVATYVGVEYDQVSYLRRPYVRLILEGKTAAEAVEIIRGFNPRIGGNLLVADATDCFEIEAVPEKYWVGEVDSEVAKTNHFRHISRKNMSFAKPGFVAWSATREKRALELMGDIRSVEDMQAVLRDQKHADKRVPICATSSERECYTHSALVLDAGRVVAHYAQGNPLEVPFEEWGFEV